MVLILWIFFWWCYPQRCYAYNIDHLSFNYWSLVFTNLTSSLSLFIILLWLPDFPLSHLALCNCPRQNRNSCQIDYLWLCYLFFRQPLSATLQLCVCASGYINTCIGENIPDSNWSWHVAKHMQCTAKDALSLSWLPYHGWAVSFTKANDKRRIGLFFPTW